MRGYPPHTESVGTVAAYDNYTAELLEADFYTDDNGKSIVRVSVNYTNNNSDGMYMLESFVVKAFQDDTELVDLTDINDDKQSVTLIKEVKDGQSIAGSYVFELSSTSPVEVRICSPTADEELLAMREYAYEAQNTD